MKLLFCLSFVLLPRILFCQLLIGLGGGVESMNFTTEQKNYFKPPQTHNIPCGHFSIGVIHKNFYPELRVDFTKQTLDFYFHGDNPFNSMGGAGNSTFNIKYNMILSHIALLLQYRTNGENTKLYFGFGPSYGFNINSSYSGLEKQWGWSANINGGFNSIDTTIYYTNEKYSHAFFKVCLTAGLDIPVSERAWLSPCFTLRWGNYQFEHAPSWERHLYPFRGLYSSVSLKYLLKPKEDEKKQ